jgi:hypothetical protein
MITRTAAAGALCLAQVACTATTPAPAIAGSVRPAVSSATPAQAGIGGGGGIFSGSRRIAISMESGPPATLIVDAEGKLISNVRLTDRSLFVLVPTGGQHQIRTAAGDPACMGVRGVTGGPDIVVAAVCDADAEGQLFTITRRADRDSKGRRNHQISTTAGELTFSSRDGVHIQPHGDGAATGFAFIDKGPAGCSPV